jgi:hypothetical protein
MHSERAPLFLKVAAWGGYLPALPAADYRDLCL